MIEQVELGQVVVDPRSRLHGVARAKGTRLGRDGVTRPIVIVERKVMSGGAEVGVEEVRYDAARLRLCGPIAVVMPKNKARALALGTPYVESRRVELDAAEPVI